MTILQINKYYYPRGGADVVMLELARLLEAHGHTVVPFAMTSPENLPTPYAHSFPSEVKTESVQLNWQGLRTAGRMLYSCEVKRKLSRLIRATKPSIAHLHNIYHQLSPAVFRPLHHAHLPVVMTVHDWALISPNYTLFDHGEICERGVGHPWSIVKHRCIKDSLVASAWAAFVFSIHKFLKMYEHGVDHYIAPSEFVKTKLVAAGFNDKKIEVIPHFVDVSNISPVAEGDYMAYIGRLSPEKGIPVLLAAAKILSEIPFKIAGTGPEESKIRAIIEAEKLTNVELVGRLDGVARDRFYRHAKCVVVPSIWYEIFGRIVLEAYGWGKPVIASDIGALPELVHSGETGLLFPMGDAPALANRISTLVQDPVFSARLGLAGRRLVETEYAPELHYERTINLYQSLLGKKV